MKRYKIFPVLLMALASMLGFVGCVATNATITKERGVYTTVAVSGQNLDMPGSGYTSCKTFGPGQTPAAVVVGYGYLDGGNNHPQPFTLNIVEAASGTVIHSLNGNAFAYKAAVFDLPIRKSGDYRLNLIINDSVYDTWDFTVNRETSAGTGLTSPPVYAKGNFSASIEGIPEAFTKYDDYLLQALTDAVNKEYANGNHADFAQLPAGQVVVQFDLNEAGQVSSPKIIENTLNETLGKFYLRALENGSPYKAWPANVRAVFGSNSRSIKVIFFYD
jgi:hypothetical protein